MLDFQAARWLQMRSRWPQQAGNNHPTTYPDRRVQDHRRRHQHRRQRGRMWERLCHAIGAPRIDRPARFRHRACPLENRDAADARNRASHGNQVQSAEWIDVLTKPACRRARFIRSTRCSPTLRSSTLASRRTASGRHGTMHTFVGQPMAPLAHTERIRYARRREGRVHRRGAQGIRFHRARSPDTCMMQGGI